MDVPGADVLAVSSRGELAWRSGTGSRSGGRASGRSPECPLAAEPRARSSSESRTPTGRRTVWAWPSYGGRAPQASRVPDREDPLRDGRMDSTRASARREERRVPRPPRPGRQRPSVKVVGPDGVVRTVSASAANGLSWSASGEELLFPGGNGLRAASLVGPVPRPLPLARGNPPQGRLVGRARPRDPHDAAARDCGAPARRDPRPQPLVARLVLPHRSLGRRPVRPLRGAEPGGGVRALPEADRRRRARSPRGRACPRVVARRQVGPHDQTADGGRELLLLPTGAGETRRLAGPRSSPPRPRSFRAASAWSSPAASRVEARGLHLHLATAKLAAMSPEGITAYFNAIASPDGPSLSRRAPRGG